MHQAVACIASRVVSLALCGKPDRGPSAALSAQLRCLPIAGTGLPGDVDWVSGVRIAWIVRKKQALSDLFFSYAPEAIRTPDARFRKSETIVEIPTFT